MTCVLKLEKQHGSFFTFSLHFVLVVVLVKFDFSTAWFSTNFWVVQHRNFLRWKIWFSFPAGGFIDSRDFNSFKLRQRIFGVGLKESSNQTSRLSIPGNCIVLLWVLTYCLISTVYKHKYLRDIKLLLAVGFARFESFSSEIWLARPVQSSGEFHYQSGLSSQISLFKNMIWLFGKCPKITTFLSTARNI